MKDYLEWNGKRIQIPDIALGKTAPYFVDVLAREEELRKRAERKARLYFIGGIVGTLAGTVLGWLLGKFC